MTEHETGRVTIVFTLAAGGRLKPLDEVQLVVPRREKNPDGGSWADLVVSIDMRETKDGPTVGRVHLREEGAARAKIRLKTHTMDGKLDPLTRLHHMIPIVKHLKLEGQIAPGSFFVVNSTKLTQGVTKDPLARERPVGRSGLRV